jgi:hypothetical protein
MKKTELIILVFLIVLCGNNLILPIENTKTDRFSVSIEEEFRIGSDDLDDDANIFSGINDIKIGDDGAIYILDRRNMRIQKYTNNGEYIKTFTLKKGQGPHEFMHPISFDVDKQNRLYISDMTQRRITVLSSENNLEKMIKTDIQPTLITAVENRVYAVGGVFDEGAFLIHQYDIASKRLVNKLCKSDTNSRRFMKAGGFGQLCKDKDGSLFYSFWIPYKIIKFDLRGKRVKEYSRETPFPQRIYKNKFGRYDMNVYSKALGVFPDGKVLSVICDVSKVPAEHSFDIFNENGEFLCSFDSKTFSPAWDGRIVRIDGNGDLYLEYWNTYPHLRKYSLDIVEN